MDIPSIHISDYTYPLPQERIASYPLPERDRSKLLVWESNKIYESRFYHIGDYLPERSLLVFNNTRVIHARLIFFRETGARIEIFCLEPFQPSDFQISFGSKERVVWKCLIGNARKWKQGFLEQTVSIRGRAIRLRAEAVSKMDDFSFVRFEWDSPVTFAEIIEEAGKVPIPPYLNRSAEEIDNDRYQTVYARISGSVAAPTAGLHFTESVLEKLKKGRITPTELTLHVGAGTFKPVKSDRIVDHSMHTESVFIHRNFLHQLLSRKGPVIAVGTTSVRSLESLCLLGAGIDNIPPGNPLHVSQWEPYGKSGFIEPSLAIGKLLHRMDALKTDELSFTTSLMIVPGYRFQLTEGIITNFHQPKSTLLLLIGAFLGNDWKRVYQYALDHDFRFLSYGDSNLYLKHRE